MVLRIKISLENNRFNVMSAIKWERWHLCKGPLFLLCLPCLKSWTSLDDTPPESAITTHCCKSGDHTQIWSDRLSHWFSEHRIILNSVLPWWAEYWPAQLTPKQQGEPNYKHKGQLDDRFCQEKSSDAYVSHFTCKQKHWHPPLFNALFANAAKFACKNALFSVLFPGPMF